MQIPPAPRPRLGAVTILHRFGSGLNRHAHLHAAVTDGVFLPGPHGRDGPPAFLPTRPLTQGNLAALTARVRRRVIAFIKRQWFLDAHAAADMLAWENSGFSIDASVRITLLDHDVPSYFQSLEHLLRYCARPPFALDRLSVIRVADGRIALLPTITRRTSGREGYRVTGGSGRITAKLRASPGRVAHSSGVSAAMVARSA